MTRPSLVMTKASNNGLVVWLSFMAFLQSLASAGVMADILGHTGAAVLLAFVGSLNAGTAAYVAGTKPISDRAGSLREGENIHGR